MNAATTATSGAAISDNPALEHDYFRNVLPDPYRVLGLALRPLSLGRYRLLRRFNVAFVADETAHAAVGDLLLGVLICSMRCDDFVEFANSPHFNREIRRWSRRVFPCPWLGCLPFGIGGWWRRRAGFNVIQKIALFQRYIQEHSRCPRYWDESPGGGRVSGAHWSHSVEVALLSKVGWTVDEINEQPLTKAIWDYFKFMESEGFVRLMTADEISYIDTPASAAEQAAIEKWAKELQRAGIGAQFQPN